MAHTFTAVYNEHFGRYSEAVDDKLEELLNRLDSWVGDSDDQDQINHANQFLMKSFFIFFRRQGY